ncbi:MAG: hypothetical protein NT093_04495, partial [Candidatus Moranbacteria bacterium]|nr:hypothetical protein [Candidatus Moranbacteria bacterium]
QKMLMSNWSKSVIYGGIYPKTQSQTDCLQCDQKIACKYREFTGQLEKYRKIMRKIWQISRKVQLSIKNNLKTHVSKKQELYWPVLVAITLLLFVFASKIAFADESGAPNNLPIESNSKLNIIGFQKKTIQPNVIAIEGIDSENEDLKNDIADILENTPMAAMIDSISKKDRIVAAFIIGIAMKESKFGVYSPKMGGRECYNNWGLKAGGKTTAGGYTCFSSPEDAVNGVSKTIEKMVAKGVQTPAQAIGWKCGSSCAGHDPTGVRKWVSDVAINFNKINSKKNS